MHKIIQKSVVVITLIIMGSVVHKMNKEHVCQECRKKQKYINR